MAAFSKHLLTFDDNFDKSIGHVVGDALNDLGVTYINMTNRLHLISVIQEIFDIVNPHVNNQFSAFDIDFDQNEDGFYFDLRFMNEWSTIQDEVYRETVTITYAKEI